jgi:putative two-component system response regulator
MPNRVLLVEDDDIQRQLSEILLTREGLSVTAVADGLEAEYELATAQFDLALLDINVPHRNGFEICEGIKRNPETRLTPVILLTGYNDSESRMRGLLAEADDFLAKPIDPIELKMRIKNLLKRKQYTDELEHAEQVLMTLGRSIEAKDPLTRGHCERISHLSVLFGQELGLDERELKALGIAGSVHDIGKVTVPDHILLKRGPLLPDEWEIMRSHAVAGERICQPLRSMQLVTQIIRCHHERQDGTGYPDGIKGDDIPLLARVTQIVDIFDALTSDRPYRAALPISTALAIMQEETERGWWDYELFSRFRSLARTDAVYACLMESERTQVA